MWLNANDLSVRVSGFFEENRRIGKMRDHPKYTNFTKFHVFTDDQSFSVDLIN